MYKLSILLALCALSAITSCQASDDRFREPNRYPAKKTTLQPTPSSFGNRPNFLTPPQNRVNTPTSVTGSQPTRPTTPLQFTNYTVPQSSTQRTAFAPFQAVTFIAEDPSTYLETNSSDDSSDSN